MKKYILLTALAAVALAGSAQETMYLIKGNQVVAKYNVADVDYAAFKLPEGVTDIIGEGQVLSKTYISASPVYLGTLDGCGSFQIQFSTKDIMNENPPLDMMYLDMTTPLVTDIKDIQIAEGTYTLGAADKIEPFKFYPGVHVSSGGQEVPAGSLIFQRPDMLAENDTYTFITDGSFTVKRAGSQYTLTGMLKLADGNVLEFKYDGPMVVINQSDEKPSAEDLPLPESGLTENCAFTPLATEAYVTNYKKYFADFPNLDYYMFSLYGDANYEDCLDVALVVDRVAYPDVLLPKGTYKVFSRTDGSLSTLKLGACPAFKVMGDQVILDGGCWLTLDYSTKAPLVSGEVEILEDVVSWNQVKMRVKLYDNASTPHTVTCDFSGSVSLIEI